MCVKSSVYSTHVELLLSDLLCAPLLLFYWWIFVVVVVVVFFVLCFFWLLFFLVEFCVYILLYTYIYWRLVPYMGEKCIILLRCIAEWYVLCVPHMYETRNTQSPYARSHLHIVRTNTCVDNNQQNKSTHISKSTNSHTPVVAKHSISNIEPGRIQMNGRIIEIHTTMPRSNNEYWSE